MKAILSFFARLFGRGRAPSNLQEDYLPGERARTKHTGVTEQQMAWRKVSDEMGDRSRAAKPERNSEFERLLRK